MSGPHDPCIRESRRHASAREGRDLPQNFHRLTERRRQLLSLLLEPEGNSSEGAVHVDDIVTLSALGLIEVDAQGAMRLTPKGLAETKQPRDT